MTISGGGSLTASGSSNGLRAVSTISNAALAIEGTAVKLVAPIVREFWCRLVKVPPDLCLWMEAA